MCIYNMNYCNYSKMTLCVVPLEYFPFYFSALLLSPLNKKGQFSIAALICFGKTSETETHSDNNNRQESERKSML